MKTIAFTILVVCGLWVGSVIAQQDSETPLQLRLLSAKASKTKMYAEIQAKIINVSHSAIVVDETLVFYQLHFRKGDDTLTKLGDVGPGYAGRYVVLEPGESFIAKRSIDLSDKFFCSDSEYGLLIKYGQFIQTSYANIEIWRGVVQSNEIIFNNQRDVSKRKSCQKHD